MDISKPEQRVLHLLAQGGIIRLEKDQKRKIISTQCLTREGWASPVCTIELFKKLKRRHFIISRNDGPYRITKLGIIRVRGQLNNR